MEKLSAAVLGTVCCDEIQRNGNDPDFAYGGIFYSLVTLGQLFNGKGSIYPVCKIGAEDYPEIIKQFTKYSSIKPDYIKRYPGKNNTVVLKYYSQEERKEYSTNLPAPFTIGELIPIPDVRLYLINFISGIEMGYRTFRALRKRLNTPVYVDLHSLFLGFRKNSERYYRMKEDWSHWHSSGDIVQMNRTEATVLAGRSLSTKIDFLNFGNYLLTKGADTVIFTNSSKGSLIIWKSGKRTFHKLVQPYKYGKAQDPTGCGDVFAGAYVFRYLQGADPPEAAGFASKVAGIRASHMLSSELHNLKLILKEKKISTSFQKSLVT